MTVAKRNEILRKKAEEIVLNENLEGVLFQVAGSKFMLNVELEGEKYPVRIDFVVPKIDTDDELQFAEDFAEAYQFDQEEKEKEKAEKAQAKAKKKARDEEERRQKKEALEKKKAEKERKQKKQ